MVIKKQNKQKKSSCSHIYAPYTVPAVPFTSKAEVDSLPFLFMVLWTSAFFSSGPFKNVNVYVGDGERNVGKGFAQQETR